MKKILFYKILLIITFSLLFFACTRADKTGNMLHSFKNIDIKKFQYPLNCKIEVKSVIDRRSEFERKGVSQKKYHTFIPLLLLFMWTSAGPIYTDIDSYDYDFIGSLDKIIIDTIKKSNLSSNNESRKYVLQPELLHFYSVSYEKGVYAFGAGGMAETHNYFPTGYVCIKLSLFNEKTPTQKQVRYITNAFLFNPSAKKLSINHTAMTGIVESEKNKVAVALISLEKALKSLPNVVDEMLAEEKLGKSVGIKPKTFMIVRLTKEYDFQEEMIIDYDTGLVISDTIVPRTTAIISKPNEWVVPPYSESGHWLSSKDYGYYIDILKLKYKVKYKDNITCANFYGIK